MKTGNRQYQDHVYAKCRVRQEGSDNFHYIYCLVDTGNQSRETIISEELFYKITAKGAQINKSPAQINEINESMHLLGRSADTIDLEFYSPSPKYPEKVTYPCRPLVARGVNIDFLLSNADLCKMDARLRPAHGAMYLPLQGQQVL